MRILLSNDDSIYSKGILALVEALHELDIPEILPPVESSHEKVKQPSAGDLVKTIDLVVVAPEEEQSAKSHSFTLREPILIKRVPYAFMGNQGKRCVLERISLTGTPADTVYFATVTMSPFDWVVSGINHGSNLGNDVHYSGTVAAAREAAFRGVPAIAVSLHPFPGGEQDYARAAAFVADLLPKLPPPPLGSFYNLNIPDLPAERQIKLKTAFLGKRSYEASVDVRTSPSGIEYCWIGGAPINISLDDQSDVALCDQGYATLSVIKLDTTDYEALEELDRLL